MLTLFLGLLALTCVLAIAVGGRDDRIGAASFATATVLTQNSRDIIGDFSSTESAIALIDFGLLAILLYLVLRSQRFWPLWAFGFHLVAVLTHLAAGIDPEIVPRAYAAALGLWSFPTLSALTISLVLRVGSAIISRRGSI